MSSSLKVDPAALSQYGSMIHDFGEDNVRATGQETPSACGKTSDMEGLLDVIAPAIRAVAQSFGQHYQTIGTNIAQSGIALEHTATYYQNTDRSVAARMDKHAVSVAGGHDGAWGSGGGWSETYSFVQTYDADADPAKAIRDGMDADVRGIDWVFNKFTGHHITEPLDHLVGNWTTLTARGKSWHDVSTCLKQHAVDMANHANVVDQRWDGVAAASFQAYATRMSNGLKAESEVPLGIQVALDKTADEWKSLYQQAVDLLQSVIHDVEIAATAMAAGWWCGIGEAVAAKKCQEALVAFYRAYRIVNAVRHLIEAANAAVKGFEDLKHALDVATHLPSVIEGKLNDLENLLKDLGAAPSILENLTHIGDTPTSPYGGPNNPGVK